MGCESEPRGSSRQSPDTHPDVRRNHDQAPAHFFIARTPSLLERLGDLDDPRDAAGPEGCIQVRVEPESSTCAVLVCDSGSGIPPDVGDRVFEPFYTTKTSGTGLGLAIARQLLDLQGGEIDIPASSPEGTTVRVRVPRALPMS